MGTSSLIYVMGTMLTFLIISNSILSVQSDQSTMAIGRYKTCAARNANSAVVNMLSTQVSANPSYRATTFTTINCLNGYALYRVVDTLVSPDSLVKIEVRGNFSGETKVTIAYFLKPTVTATVPTAFTYASASQGNISLSGNAEILPDPAFPTANANVQTNGSFSIGGSANISGFVSYAGSFSGSTSKITPTTNPGGLPVASKVAPVTIPTFNPDDYLAKATTVYAGDLNVSGAFNLGTKASPAIIYVGGNFNMSGGASVTGYGIVIVKGNVQMSGHCTFNTMDPGTSTFGCYAAGDIQLSGTSDFYGQMLSLKDIQFSGTVNVYGTVAAGQEVQFSGNNKIYYNPASAVLTSPVFTSPGGTSTSRLTIKRFYE